MTIYNQACYRMLLFSCLKIALWQIILNNKADKKLPKADLILNNPYWIWESRTILTFWFIFLFTPMTRSVIRQILYSISRDRKLNDLLFLSSVTFMKECICFFILFFIWISSQEITSRILTGDKLFFPLIILKGS